MGDLTRSLLTGEDDPTVEAQNALEIPAGGQGVSDVLLGRNPNGRLRLSMDAAQKKNPDQEARVLRLQARTGLPADLIERNLDEVERQAERADFDPSRFRRESPIVAGWLAENPQHAAVAKDDIENLTRLETFVRGAVAVPRSLVGEFVRTPGSALSGLGELNEAAANMIGRGIRAVGADPVADFLTQTQIPWWLNPTEILRRSGDVVKGAGEAIKPPEEDRSVASDVAGGLGQLSSQIATAILAPQSTLPMLFGMGADIQAERAAEDGASPLEEDAAVIVGSGVTAVLERIGLDKLLDRVPPNIKNRIYRQLADLSIAGGIEAVQEAAEGALQNIVTALTYNPQQNILEGVPQEAGTAFAVGSLGRGILNMIIPGRQAQQARLDGERLQAMSETAAASRLRERSPELFEQLVRNMAGEGARTVYAPVEAWDTLFQDGASAAAEELLGADGAQRYREAKATGGDIAIPVEVYAARIAPSEVNARLLPELRFDPEGMSLREAEEWEANRDTMISEFMAETGQEGRPADDSSGQVYEDVLGQLLGSGMERGAAEKQATLVQSVFRSLGQRTGVDPLALYERYGFEVRREIPEALRPFAEVDTGLDPLIDRLRAGDIPSQTSIFGESLLEMLRSQGGLRDEGGELSARDAQLARGRVGDRRLVSEDGMDLDSAAEWAVQLGYIPERDTDMLLEAIDEELRGNPVYPLGSEDQNLLGLRQALEQLDEELSRAGIDVNKVSNDTIKAFLAGEVDEELIAARMATDPDGITYDQQGRAVTDSDAFRRWFGDSKVVDENGEPLVVYHGTEYDFDAFDLNRIGNNWPGSVGFYFTNDPAEAELYTEDDGSVMPVYLSIKNPLRRKSGDQTPFDYVDEHFDSLKEEAAGRDGMIVEDDHGLALYIAFRPEQIKSAVGNRGTFDPADPNILNQDQPGPLRRLFQSLVDTIAGPSNAPLVELYTVDGQPTPADPNTPRGVAIRSLARPLAFPLDLVLDTFEQAGQQEFADQVRAEVDDLDGRVEFVQAARDAEQVLFQDRSGSRGGKRGMIQFDPSRERFRVTLLQKADLSTFLHESGHFYLEVLRDLAERGEGDERLQADYRTLLDWLGVAEGGAIGTEQHEQFARGFEAYLMEGRSPSPALQGVFARFRAWLVGIYRALQNLNVELTDEVRGVFDRLVATDEEIAAAEESQNYQALFEDAEAAGMSDEEFDAYRTAIEAARAEAVEDVTRQAMNEITREARSWWNDRRTEVRREVEGEVNQRPVYMAMFFLQRGALPDGRPLPEGVRPMKLSKAALVDAYGEAFLRRLPRPYVYTREGGVHPDTVAPLFGFRSGDELVEALVNARPRGQIIEAETDERMREQYGDIRTDGSLPEKALAAVHNEKRAQVMVRELRLLHARARVPGRPTTLQVAKAAAARIIGQRRVRDIQPQVYRVAEAKAARQAFEAVAEGDFLAAAEAKRRQLLNHELYRQARDAREEIDKTVTYLRGFDKKATRERIGKAGADYLEQIDAILDRFDLSPISNRALDRRKALAAWVADQEAQGFQVDVPEDLLNEARRVSYRELPLEQLLGVRDTVRNIEHLAKLKNQLLANKKHRDMESAVDDIVSAIEREHGPGGPQPPNFAPGLKDRMGDAFSRFDAAHTKMEFLFRYLDGGEVGPVWEALFKPLADAEGAEQVMMREATQRLREIFGVYSRKERALMHLTRIHVPEVGQSFTRASLLAVALNWGNVYNRDVLMRGYGWNEGQVEAILRRLDARDWDVVENIWTFIDGYWPEIEQIQKDLTGLPPEKVEADPFTVTVNGQPRELRGGYYPIKYDAGLSFRQQQLEERAQTRELYGNNWLRPATRKGHTKERTDSGGKPVLLDLAVLTQHVTNVVHDLSHRRAILDIDRLIQNPRVAAAIEGAAGRAMHRELRPWLQSIANDIREPAGPFERILGHARMGASVVNMGWKITTAIVQPLGYLQSADVLGERYAWVGLKKFYGQNPLKQRETVRWVMEQSEMMRNRQRTFDRDVRDALKGMTLSGQAADVQRSFFYLTGLMDMGVAVPTWLGAYQKAMDGAVENVDAGDRLRAIDYADSVVRTSQSAGGAKDLARIQRGSEYHRIFTMFYSYFSVVYNLFKRRFQLTRGVSDVPRFAASMFYLWFVPSVLAELIAGRGPEDEEEWPAWAAGKLISYPFQAVVGLRDLVNAMGPYGYDASPAFDAFEQTVRAVKGAAEAVATDEEFEESDARSAALAIGYWAQLPARQMWITGSYLYDWITGEEDPESFGEVLRGLAFARREE